MTGNLLSTTPLPSTDSSMVRVAHKTLFAKDVCAEATEFRVLVQLLQDENELLTVMLETTEKSTKESIHLPTDVLSSLRDALSEVIAISTFISPKSTTTQLDAVETKAIASLETQTNPTPAPAPASSISFKNNNNNNNSNKERSVFVTALAWATTDETLFRHFSTVGAVVKASVLRRNQHGKLNQSIGCGIVEFEAVESVTTAIASLNTSELDGRKIHVRADRDFSNSNSNNVNSNSSI